jgi:DNA-3-methyladenine glycosylase
LGAEMILPLDFYLRADVVQVAQDLLGKLLITKVNGKLTTGIITETEAYAGITDRASHAFGNRRTSRTESMYLQGGVAYVYLCYGIHHLFNVVTNMAEIPHAVLIRSVEPVDGISYMKIRRNTEAITQLTNGPGKLSQALGISTRHDRSNLLQGPVRIEDSGIRVSQTDIQISTRIGVDYAGEDAKLPYRFYLKNSDFISIR